MASEEVVKLMKLTPCKRSQNRVIELSELLRSEKAGERERERERESEEGGGGGVRGFRNTHLKLLQLLNSFILLLRGSKQTPHSRVGFAEGLPQLYELSQGRIDDLWGLQ